MAAFIPPMLAAGFAGLNLGSVLGLAAPALGSVASGAFSAAAVERERAWSEKMYNKYNSPAALVRQYEEAGINPALMFGQSAIPAPTTSTAAVAPENPFGDVVGMLGALMQLDLLGEQKRGLQISNDSASFEFGLRSKYAETQIGKELNLLDSEIGRNKADAALAWATEQLRTKEGEILDLEKVVRQWEAGFIKEFHVSPELAGQLASGLGHLLSGIVSQWLRSPLSAPVPRGGR